MQEEQPQMELFLPRYWEVFWSMILDASMFVQVVKSIALSWIAVRVFQQAESSGYIVLMR